MNRCHVHVLYEYGVDLRPHGSAFIRLLRPLSHPALGDGLEVTAGPRYAGQKADAVIVDRLWRPDVSLALAEQLLQDVRRFGAKFIYALDDNLLDLPSRRLSLVSQEEVWPREEHRQVLELWLRQADGVLVTTPALKQRFAGFNDRIVVLPNVLDERLLPGAGLVPRPSPFGAQGLVVGYMGTLTHDSDLMMILPALRAVWARHPNLELQLLGVIGNADTLAELDGLRVRLIGPGPEEAEYPLFMLWFSGHVRWDIALAPLQESVFNGGKSDIKYLDYSAIGAAGIYSRVPAYAASVRHRETGWLAENTPEAWSEALEALLTDEALRRRITLQAAQTLYRERILARRARDWCCAIEQLLGG
jgi:glycosyltransferase involved in cell wall biosynthesis